MRTIAVIHADFGQCFLGMPARFTADLRGEAILRRTLRHLRKTAGLASIHLLVDASQESAARGAVAGLDVAVETHQAGLPPWARYVASGRKWSLDAWRGGMAGTTAFDEYSHPWLLDALARRERADAVVDVPPAAPLLDPVLLGNLIEYYAKVHDEVRLAFAQSAPGISAVVYHPELLANLVQVAQPPGRSMAYRPDDPHNDAIHQPCWFATEAAVAHAAGRCVADTSTAMLRLERAVDELDLSDPERTPDALTVSQWLLDQRNRRFDTLPAEVEIEITTQDPLAESAFRPRGRALERSATMDLSVYRRIIDELVRYDDRLIVLGGFGDPLAHPQWPDFIGYARKTGVLGIALRTSGVALDERAIEALVESDLDVLNVLIDADSAGTYRALHGADHFDRIVANIDLLCTLQQQRKIPRPLIVCEMMKTPQTMNEIEGFYDRWIRKTASAVIAGPSHHAGQWPDQAVVRMAPPTRFPCSRLPHRATILADGRMTLCDQDFRGGAAIGSLQHSSLAELWASATLQEARRLHVAGDWAALPLCGNCDEWHRP